MNKYDIAGGEFVANEANDGDKTFQQHINNVHIWWGTKRLAQGDVILILWEQDFSIK